MKKSFLVLLVALIGWGNSPRAQAASPDAAAWDAVPEILARIVPPTFPDRDFPLTDYGAVGDGQTDCTAAFRAAVAACHAAGGGHVVVPAGDFLTGPIHLLSDVDLHLAVTNATIRFQTDPAAYLPPVFTRFEGTELYNLSPLIYALDQTNLAVTGVGTLDGQATSTNWWAWSKNNTRHQLVDQAARGIPPEQRRYGLTDHLRPSFLEFCRCRNILVSGVHIRRSPMWEIHPLLSTNITVRGVDIFSHGPNNDGCDPECCRDVLIEGCTFDTGDDCIAIKSGRNADGRRVGLPSVNLVIRDCTMRDGHAGTAIGSEISGSCSNVFVERCEMSSPNLVSALRLKSNAMRGGVLQNIHLRDVHVGQVKKAVLLIEFLYDEGTNGPYHPVAQDVSLANVRVDRAPRVLDVQGFPAATIRNIRIYDSTFHQISKPDQVIDADAKLIDCQRDFKN